MGRPLIFGEVVFDIYPDGRKVLGGAPFNVAWHLRGFGLDPLMLSCVGRDENGQRVIDRMKAWGMDLSGIERSADYPTGTVRVTYENGEPDFNILPDQAYDFIKLENGLPEITKNQSADILYHGSLALREQISRDTFLRIADATGVPIFLDVNLRDPWWRAKNIEQMIKNARWLKLNDDELCTLCGGDGPKEAGELQRAYDLDALIVTKGGQGAFVLTKAGELYAVKASEDVEIVDTVGAGDAFSSVCLLSLIHKWPWPRALEKAADFAARLCRIKGATTEDKSLYASMKNPSCF